MLNFYGELPAKTTIMQKLLLQKSNPSPAAQENECLHTFPCLTPHRDHEKWSYGKDSERRELWERREGAPTSCSPPASHSRVQSRASALPFLSLGHQEMNAQRTPPTPSGFCVSGGVLGCSLARASAWQHQGWWKQPGVVPPLPPPSPLLTLTRHLLAD